MRSRFRSFSRVLTPLFRLAKIIYFYSEPSGRILAHLQWFEHRSNPAGTFVAGVAPYRHLFLKENCQCYDASLLLGR